MKIVGPSYTLNHRKADTQRSVNLMPVVNEVPTGKSVAYLDSVPGLNAFGAPGMILVEDGGFLLWEDATITALE